MPVRARGRILRVTKEEAMKTIIVGYEETETGLRALERAAGLAEAFQARLVVTSVAGVLAPVGLGYAGVDPLDPLDDRREELERARTRIGEREIEAAFVAAVGDPARAILD